MLAAPLMAGNDLRTMTDEVREILIAPEIVAIDQDSLGKQGRRIRRDGDTEIWIRELAAGHRVVAAFNRGLDHREVRISLEELGIAPRTDVRVRDLWQRTDVGVVRREIVTATRPVSATVLRVAQQ